jgi:acetyltransferase-like isoleucine patch superfamily enzyme
MILVCPVLETCDGAVVQRHRETHRLVCFALLQEKFFSGIILSLLKRITRFFANHDVKDLFSNYDIRYLIFEIFSLWVGNVSTKVSRFIYGNRLIIAPPFKVWGKIRFLIHGPGSIVIGKNFHAVSSRRRSFFTLFSPCHLTIIGNAEIILGEHVGLNGTTIVSRKKISIGNNTMIAPNTIISDNDSHVAWPPSERWSKSDEGSEITIESDVWIGMNCIILKGVRIGHGSIIAAGSVVTGDVEPNSLYAGNPARKIKEMMESDLR